MFVIHQVFVSVAGVIKNIRTDIFIKHNTSCKKCRLLLAKILQSLPCVICKGVPPEEDLWMFIDIDALEE